MTDYRSLIKALVIPDHDLLYMQNAWFRHAVDTFATFIPLVIDGLASRAEEEDRELRAATEGMERGWSDHSYGLFQFGPTHDHD